MEVKTATVAALSASSLTAWLHDNLNSEAAFLVVGISTILGLIFAIIYYHNRQSTLIASVGLIVAMFAFLPTYTHISKYVATTTAFFTSLFIAFITPFMLVYLVNSSIIKKVGLIIEEAILQKIKKILQIK
tara:strand:- start:1337 stop:1729 length:393 start_codon:yes stop_codon:yes gene_type:complete